MTPREILIADADRMGSESYGDDCGSLETAYAITCPRRSAQCHRAPGSDLCFECAIEDDAKWEAFCTRFGMDPHPKAAS